jgi:hypothetical protein
MSPEKLAEVKTEANGRRNLPVINVHKNLPESCLREIVTEPAEARLAWRGTDRIESWSGGVAADGRGKGGELIANPIY